LFGVDINPNSVKICRLRLWIELLKNAYYKNETELETLPNIDINIKCGNSLISRFAIDADLKQALRKSASKWTIDSYRIAVDTYRNAQSKEQKREMERLINEIKTNFRSEISQNDPKVKRLRNLSGELFTMTNQGQLFELSKKEKAIWNAKVTKLSAEVKKLETEIEEIKNNKIYENAFEWRFEFPEVLNDNGDFVGFDVVIGNPPYGVSIKGQYREHLVLHLDKVPDYEIFFWFINKGHELLKTNGVISLIIPNTILFNVYAQNYRLELFDKWEISEILDCTDLKIFEDATVRNIIFIFTKSENCKSLTYKRTNDLFNFSDFCEREKVKIPKDIVELNNQNWGLIFKVSPEVLKIVAKIKKQTIPLINFFPETSQGLIAYDKYRGQSEEIIRNRVYHTFKKTKESHKKWLYGEDVTRYKVKWNEKEYIDYCPNIANPRNPKFFLGKRILIREITNPRIFAAIVEEELYNDPAILIIKDNPCDFSIETLLGILNSKLATFFHFNSSPKATKGTFPKILVYDINNFPLPTFINSDKNFQIKELVEKILANITSVPVEDNKVLETQIDHLVYQLYELTPEEIAIIEGGV
jgi:hypothetical protein